jgi:hypothetical protein
VRVVATLRLKAGAQRDSAERAALQRLHTLLHPLNGGLDGRGWPFAGILTTEAVKQWLMLLDAVQAVSTIELQEVDDVGARRVAASQQIVKAQVTEIKLQPGEMLISGHHTIAWAG